MKLSKIALAVTLMLPIVAMANGGGHHEVSMTNSDFFYRVLNFSIFAGLLYYLAANPIKAFFEGRQADIANQLKEIEDKLQASKQEAKEAEEQLAKSEEKAKEIIADSLLEGKILAENIAKKSEDLLNSMEKQLEEKMELESKKVAKETVTKLLQEGIDSDDIAVDESKVVSLIAGKVA